MLTQSLIIVFVYFTSWYILAAILKNASIVDIGWGLGFVVIAAFGFIKNIEVHTLIIFIIVGIWGLRLSSHIFKRNYGKPEDFRYANFRKEWGKIYYIRSYFQLFLFQGALMFLISMAFSYAFLSESIYNLPIFFIGIIVWIIGFFFEAVGDYQLKIFGSDPNNKGKVISVGLWNYTRHPNYFGESVMWWGIYIMALACGAPWFTIISPITITVMVRFVSGVPMLEKIFPKERDLKTISEQRILLSLGLKRGEKIEKNIFLVSQTIFFLAFLGLLGSIIYGVTQLDMFEEGGLMLELFWGKFTFIDIYIAFIVFYLWVFIREEKNVIRLLWFFLIMIGGSMTICLYIFLAIRNCHYDIKKLLLGHLEVSSNAK